MSAPSVVSSGTGQFTAGYPLNITISNNPAGAVYTLLTYFVSLGGSSSTPAITPTATIANVSMGSPISTITGLFANGNATGTLFVWGKLNPASGNIVISGGTYDYYNSSTAIALNLANVANGSYQVGNISAVATTGAGTTTATVALSSNDTSVIGFTGQSPFGADVTLTGTPTPTSITSVLYAADGSAYSGAGYQAGGITGASRSMTWTASYGGGGPATGRTLEVILIELYGTTSTIPQTIGPVATTAINAILGSVTVSIGTPQLITVDYLHIAPTLGGVTVTNTPVAAIPPKLLKINITSITAYADWTGGGSYQNSTYKWTVDIIVFAQYNSIPPNYYYNGLDISAGDWLSNALGGRAWRIDSIISQTTSSMTCIIEDVRQYNTYTDPTGTSSGSGAPIAGDGFLFTLVSSMPTLTPVENLVLPYTWQTDTISRFVSTFISPPIVSVNFTDIETATFPTPTPLSVVGNQFVDSSGNIVRLNSINWYGYDGPSLLVHGLYTGRSYTAMIDQIVELGFNTIRLPFSDDMVMGLNSQLLFGTVPGNQYLGPLDSIMWGLNSLQTLDIIVDYCAQVGVRIILDQHRISMLADGSIYDNQYGTDGWPLANPYVFTVSSELPLGGYIFWGLSSANPAPYRPQVEWVQLWTQLANHFKRDNYTPNNTLASATIVVTSTGTTSLTVSSVASGTIALGSVIYGNGVNISKFTATSSGTTLTVSAISQGIVWNGQTITGTGISGTVIIINQISPLTVGETVGGVGRYITSAVTTCSSAAITANNGTNSVVKIVSQSSGTIGGAGVYVTSLATKCTAGTTIIAYGDGVSTSYYGMYASNPVLQNVIIGFDPHNEPRNAPWPTWTNMCENLFPIVNAIVPNWIMFVEGIGSGASSYTSTASGTTLTVTAPTTVAVLNGGTVGTAPNLVLVGQTITGNGITGTQFTGTANHSTTLNVTYVNAATGIGYINIGDVITGIGVNVTQFTATSSGTTLTVSAISQGIIYQYSSVTGSGISSGTTIVAQVSGTSGGVGVYTTNIASSMGSATACSSTGGSVHINSQLNGIPGGIGNYITNVMTFCTASTLSTAVKIVSQLTTTVPGVNGVAGTYLISQPTTITTSTLVTANDNWWWGGYLKGARVRPINSSIVPSNRLAYSPHDYGQSVSTQPWLSSNSSTFPLPQGYPYSSQQSIVNYPNNLEALWNEYWGFIYTDLNVPIWLGEFGGGFGVDYSTGLPDSNQTSSVFEKQWVTALGNYLNRQLNNGTTDLTGFDLGMSYAFFALNPESGNPLGGLLENIDYSTIQVVKMNLLIDVVQFRGLT